MTEPLSLLAALLIGLSGASHCLVMCGGIAAAAGSHGGQNRFLSALLFNSGRILSYAIAGCLVGALGLWLQELHTTLMIGLRLLAGVMLILMGLYIGRWSLLLTRIEQAGQVIWKPIQPFTQKLLGRSDALSQLLLGMLWGWLPCGLIYSTLSWVAATGDPLNGALTMLIFGLGTWPAIFSASLLSASLMKLMQENNVRKLSGMLLICYGLWTLWVTGQLLT